MTYLVYALNVNGEGSSRVTLSIISNLIHRLTPASIVISSKSLLELLLLTQYQLSPLSNYGILRTYRISNISIYVLPGFLRLPILAFVIKLLFPIFLLKTKILVMDDYPFLLSSKQLLFFQQANLLHTPSMQWIIRKFFFSFLLRSSPVVFLQSSYMHCLFLKNFPLCPACSFLLRYD